MIHVELSSSMLNSVSYDPDTGSMTVVFNNGDEYLYKDVPQEVFSALASSNSAGKYFLANVKGKFEHEKV